MSQFNAVVSSWQVPEGKLVEYGTQGGEALRRTNSIGYIHEILYDTQLPGQPRASYIVYPVVPLEQATAGRAKLILNPDHEEIDKSLGLPAGRQWAIVIDPQNIHPDSIGRARDGLVRVLGDLSRSPHYDQFLEMAERFEKQGSEDAPGFAQSEPWGKYIITLKKGRNSLNAFDPQKAETKTRLDKSNKSGRLYDLSLDNAVKAGLIDAETAQALTTPEDKRVKPVTSLREAFGLSDKNSGALAKFAAKSAGADVSLKELQDKQEVHPTVVWGLSSPRTDSKENPKAEPVTMLSDAYRLVTQNPAKLKDYNYLGEKMQEHARKQIPAAYESNLLSPEDVAQDMRVKIKKAWQTFSGDYARSNGIGVDKAVAMPAHYHDEKGVPLWTFGQK